MDTDASVDEARPTSGAMRREADETGPGAAAHVVGNDDDDDEPRLEVFDDDYSGGGSHAAASREHAPSSTRRSLTDDEAGAWLADHPFSFDRVENIVSLEDDSVEDKVVRDFADDASSCSRGADHSADQHGPAVVAARAASSASHPSKRGAVAVSLDDGAYAAPHAMMLKRVKTEPAAPGVGVVEPDALDDDIIAAISSDDVGAAETATSAPSSWRDVDDTAPRDGRDAFRGGGGGGGTIPPR
mmetsp:Transcript_15426/g.62091  ORF Transcript_15426/g.62091 Transcript_15426/m.62091 type:complete len:243 (+) Transcript_15426:336-1064(+)